MGVATQKSDFHTTRSWLEVNEHFVNQQSVYGKGLSLSVNIGSIILLVERQTETRCHGLFQSQKSNYDDCFAKTKTNSSTATADTLKSHVEETSLKSVHPFLILFQFGFEVVC